MKVLLTPAMAKELFDNEEMIKAQEGPYRPQYNVALKQFVPVIKCWPLEPFKGNFIQEREVTPGMENEVDDICFAKIEDDKIKYKVIDTPTNIKWGEGTLDQYNMLIYTPNFNEKTILFSEPTPQALFEKLKEYKIVGEKEESEGTVSVRKQGAGDEGCMKFEDFAKKINEEVRNMINKL